MDRPFHELMLLYNNVAKLRQKLDGGDHASAQNDRFDRLNGAMSLTRRNGNR
jgi:hypothetical protein